MSGSAGTSGTSGTSPSGLNANIVAEDNAGIGIITGMTGDTLYTIYNTALNPTLATPAAVGGITAGTTVSELSGKTIVEIVDELLFPTELPAYAIPTITMTGVATQTLEVGSTFSSNLTAYGIKNDAGPFTQLRILRNGLIILSDNTLTSSLEADVPSEFGYADPNNPNFRYTISPTPYSESYVIPIPSGTTTSRITTYWVDGNYNAGLARQDNKGNIDTTPPAVRSINAPQAASTNFTSASSIITGIYPYFYGTSNTLPTAASIATAISGGTATKVVALLPVH